MEGLSSYSIAVDEESSFIYNTVSRVIVKTSKVINTKEQWQLARVK